MAAGAGPQCIFVHVGLPKTGTTFLQGLLREHRSALRESGVWYPDDGHRDHFFAALDARGDHVFAGGVRPAAQGAWPRLVRLAMSFDGTVLLGHEILATAPADKASEALMAFDDAEIHIVVTARDPARQVVADWQESVKHGRRHRFSQYVRHAGLVGGERSDDAQGPAPFRAQRLTEVLDNWGSGLPPGRVHVVTVPPAGATPHLLWQRFAGVVGIPDPARFLPGRDVRPNTSLGVADIEVMRRVSSYLDGRLVTGEFGAVAKNLYAQQILPRVSTSSPPAPPEDLRPRLEAIAEGWIIEIDERGYDVSGGLAELRPQWTEGSRAPDDWEPDEVIDTATAATAELLLEVARLRREASAPRTARRLLAAVRHPSAMIRRRRR